MRKLCNEYDLVAKEERKLSDILIGYLDPADHVPSAQEMAEAAAASSSSNDDDEERDGDTGPDPVEAKKRFTRTQAPVHQVLKRQSLIKRPKSQDRDKAEMEKLGELFKFFKLTPRVFDPLIR